MDSRSFETLTKRVAVELPRRRMFGLVSGVVAALFLFLREPQTASAGCKKVGRKCDKNKDCCAGARCKGGRNKKCKCKSGRQDCDGDGVCENLNTDANNCGACGVVCVSPDACCDGVCSVTCVL